MKKFVHLLIVALVVCTFNTQAQDAPRIPGASSTQTIIQDFGLGKISITYSRPNVKGRKIFGGMQPFGDVWRTGANWATTITFTEETTVEGNKVPAGTYALFTIPTEKEWTIILNKNAKQWGAYGYNEADDLLRFTVPAKTRTEKRESFTIGFSNVTTKTAELYMVWDLTAVVIKLGTNDDAQIVKNIDILMQGDKKPYFDAIQYYYENNHDLDKALAWANEAGKAEPKAPWFKLWKARILLKQGNKAAAIAAATEGVNLARANKDDEYVRLNEGVIEMAKK